MLDETNETEVVEEIVNNETEEQPTEEAPEIEAEPNAVVDEVEHKKSMLESIKEKVFGKKEAVAADDDTEGDIIPSEFVDAATKSGWTKEQIVKFASDYKDEDLKTLIPLLVKEEEEEVEADEELDPEQLEKELELSDVDEKLKPYLEKIQKEYAARDRERQTKLEELESRLTEREAEKASKEVFVKAKAADDFFDEAAKTFPVFGKTEELVRFPEGTEKAGRVVPLGPAFEARSKVWDKAVQLHTLGQDWKDSLDDAFAWYKGKYGEKELKNQLVRNLKQNEKRLSAKRTSKDVKEVHNSPYEKKLAMIEEAKRKAGIR